MKIPWRLLNIVILLITSAAGMTDIAFAQDTDASEYEIKAAFLYNFARFTEWPAKTFTNPTQSIVIGIVGSDPFGPRIMEGLKGKKVDGHPVIIRRFEHREDIDNCQVLFIGASKDEELAKIFKLAKEKNILTVGETSGFLTSGGMIRFFLDNEKIRFEVNMPPIEAASIKLSAKLLAVAAQARRVPGSM